MVRLQILDCVWLDKEIEKNSISCLNLSSTLGQKIGLDDFPQLGIPHYQNTVSVRPYRNYLTIVSFFPSFLLSFFTLSLLLFFSCFVFWLLFFFYFILFCISNQFFPRRKFVCGVLIQFSALCVCVCVYACTCVCARACFLSATQVSALHSLEFVCKVKRHW